MTRPLADRVALVTGGSRGIGRAIALELASQGCHVALTARHAPALEDTAQACRAHGVEAIVIAGDLTEPGTAKTMVDDVLARLGGLHVLVNNAGAYYEADVGVADVAAWDRLIDLNLRALMHLSHHAVAPMRRQQGGAIIHIGSDASKKSYPGGAAYCATKHGLLGFAKALFDDVRNDGIKVCTICTAFVDTDMIAGDGYPPERLLQPEDIARTVAFVLSLPERACPLEIDIWPQRNPMEH